ncbi:MAG: SiaB family protein kinase [Campylobacterota bacterium]|nr:SiaB family protein kinase [Campylobacterota bacterium]
MCNDNNLNLCLKIDENTIFEFHEKINEQAIIDTAKQIEHLLKQNNAKPAKIQDVFEILVEVMQNMLNYSYGNKLLENNKKEASGIFTLSYETTSDRYTLESCNLIEEYLQEVIERKIDSIKDLDEKALRKLSREKMRSKEDNHDKGAGLGFIMMQRKSTQPIAIEFVPYKDKIVQFKLKLIL